MRTQTIDLQGRTTATQLTGLAAVARTYDAFGRLATITKEKIEKIGTDTIIVTIHGGRGHDRSCHGLPEPLYPATRIM